MENIPQEIRACLAVLDPIELQLQDDSHLHAGHAGAREGGHYRLYIVTKNFDGMGRVARHKLVLSALSHLMQKGIHALSITALTPQEATLRSS